jgi:predicted PurR-regulated permease PerM
MGAVIGITNLIPYLGPLTGLAFGALLYPGQGLPLGSILGLAIAIAIAQLLDNRAFAPVVLSKHVALHPLTVVLVLIIGGEMLGVMGLVIAVPVAASVKIIGQEVYETYRLQVR